MKKLLPLFLAFLTGMTCNAQELKPVSKAVRDIAVTRKYNVPTNLKPPMVNKYEIPPAVKTNDWDVFVETEIIYTTYDLQSYSGLSNRIWAWEDGYVAAVATRSTETSHNYTFPDLGTGYNFCNGSEWAPRPTQRIESVRTGWPSIAGWGENGEVVVSSDFTDHRIMVLTRENKGVGPWDEKVQEGPEGGPGIAWPRMTSSGEDNAFIHVFALTLPSENGGTPWMGQDGALLYYRSGDGGETWDITDEILDGIGADDYLNIGADDYILTSKDNIVVLVIGSPWRDLAMWKSTDNGDNWEKTVIWQHPYPFFDLQTDLMTDTLWAVDGSADAAIDNDGMVHVVWGLGRVSRLEDAPPDSGYFSYWPFTDGVGYWNETMEAPIPDAENPHHTLMDTRLNDMGMLVGWSQDLNNSGVRLDFEGSSDPPFHTYRELGVSGMPSIAVCDGEIMVAFSSVTETYMTPDGQQNYKHVWVRYSYSNGNFWSEFYDVAENNIFHLYDECIYPVVTYPVAPHHYSFQFIYQVDNHPGLFLDGDQDPTTNRIIHARHEFYVGIDEPGGAPHHLNVMNVYPNPASAEATINLQLGHDVPVWVEVFNLTGQKVQDIPPTRLAAGNQTIRVDVSLLKQGAYFCKITAGAETATRKLIVE